MKLYPHKLLAPLFSLAVLLTFCTNAFSQSDVLKWKLEKDQQFDVSLTQTSNSLTKINKRETTVENETSIGMSWIVLKVSESGDATIEQAITGIKLAVSNPAIPAQAVKFDTAAEPDVAKEFSKASKVLLKQVQPLIGLKFHVTMASTGEIKSVELPDETSAAINQLPDTVRLRGLFSKTGLKGLMGSAAIVLPDTQLKDGDSWADEKEVNTALGKFNRTRDFKLVGREKKSGKTIAKFQVVPKMTAVEANEVGESLKGKLVLMNGSGELELNVEGGYFQSSKFNNTLKTERPYREKNIVTVITNEIRMTVKKK